MIYTFDNCQFNTHLYTLQRGQQVVHLRPKVFEVLLYLLEHRDRVVSKQELAEQVWPNQFIADATLESTIRDVRQACRNSGYAQRTIRTRPGHGYQFIPSVTEESKEQESQETNDATPYPRHDDLPLEALEIASDNSPLHTPFSPHVSNGGRQRSIEQSILENLSARSAPPFLGRVSYVDWFSQHLEDAMSGHPRVLLLQGEAGLGKTRLLKEMRAGAESQGVRVYSGRFFEHLTVPYLPFVEALRTDLKQTLDPVKDTINTEVELMRQLFPSPAALRSVPSDSTTAQAEQERIQLFLAVSRAFLNMAQREATVFVVDDLQWADPSSLDLFGHLIFTLADSSEDEAIPMMVVCSFRPEEAEGRLSRLLARIQREPICHTHTLKGFDEAEVQAFLQSIGLESPSHQLTATINEVTRGNPMFIQEVLIHMAHQHVLEERGGFVTTTAAPADLRLPNEVTDVISNRIGALSEDCQKVLILAALYGDAISVQVLETASGLDEDMLLDLLEEGVRHNLLASEGQALCFAHPLIRHVFYHRPSAVRRQRLHQQIAQILQRLHADHLDAYLREITHHLIRAGEATAPQVIVDYAHKSGDQAFMTAAWSEAAQYYEAALSASASIAQFSIRDRAELHYRAGLARYRDMDAGPALAHYEEAIAGYRLAGNLQGVARSLMEQTRTRYTLAAGPLGALVDIEPLATVLEALGEHETELHGNILTVMSDAYSTAQQQGKAKALARRALEMGQRLQDARLEAQAFQVLGIAQSRSLNVPEGVQAFQHAVALARRADDRLLEGAALARLPVSLMRLGQLREVEIVGQQACELTRQYQDWGAYSVPLSALTAAAVARGDFQAAERYAHETMLMVSRSHYPWAGERTVYSLACARMLRGEWMAAEAALDMLLESGPVFHQVGHTTQLTISILRQLIQSYAGKECPLPALDRDDIMIGSEIDTFSLDPWCAWVDLADFHQTPALSQRLYQVLQQAEKKGLLFAIGWLCLIPRILGVAATLNRWWDVAEAHLSSALDVAANLGALPELGRTYLNYAHMLHVRGGRGDRQRARALAEHAAALFAKISMPSFALRAKAFL